MSSVSCLIIIDGRQPRGFSPLSFHSCFIFSFFFFSPVAEPEDVSLEDQMVETTIADIVTSSGHVMDGADQTTVMADGSIHIMPQDDTEEEEGDLQSETMVHLG